MRCVYCGRLSDFHDTRTCAECRERLARINERVYLICLLQEAYEHVADIRLREKIERVIFPERIVL